MPARLTGSAASCASMSNPRCRPRSGAASCDNLGTGRDEWASRRRGLPAVASHSGRSLQVRKPASLGKPPARPSEEGGPSEEG
eukprot:4346566-Alexandrium_andersonii.AAC.1